MYVVSRVFSYLYVTDMYVVSRVFSYLYVTDMYMVSRVFCYLYVTDMYVVPENIFLYKGQSSWKQILVYNNNSIH